MPNSFCFDTPNNLFLINNGSLKNVMNEFNEIRSCFKDVTIQDVIPLKRNCQPSCAWRVYYKLRDRTPNFVEPGKSNEDFIIPLPDNDEELTKLFNHITAMVVGMSASQKNYTLDKVFAIVDYVPIHCISPVQDFNVTSEVPGMRSQLQRCP